MANNKPPDSKDSKLILAAGAVAWRPGRDGGEPEVLLVHRKKYDDWSLPKGKTEPGEPLLLTAVREVFEEGGARLILGRRLTSVRYQVGEQAQAGALVGGPGLRRGRGGGAE